MVDYDNDGSQDILSGSWPGELYLFRGKGSGEFEAAEILKDAEGNEVRAGGKDEASASVVFAHDWDGDGDLDLLIGNIHGHVWAYLREAEPAIAGTEVAPSEAEPASGKPAE